MAVVINEMEVVPASAERPTQSIEPKAQPAPTSARIQVIELAKAQRRLTARASRLRAH